MARRPRAAPLASARRAILALALAGLLLSTAGPARAVRAQDPGSPPVHPIAPVDLEPVYFEPDPAARLQVVIRTIHVHDIPFGGIAQGVGLGDMEVTTVFWHCNGPQPPCSAQVIPNNPANLFLRSFQRFEAQWGEALNLNRVVPLLEDEGASSLDSVAAGMPVYAGERYQLAINIARHGGGGLAFLMGRLQRIANASNDWGIGLYSREPVGDSPFAVTYEIRRTPLPDLRPTAIRVVDDPAQVCLGAHNAGPMGSGPFRMSLHVDRVPAPAGSVGPLALEPEETKEVCQAMSLPTSGRHHLALVVDEERAVFEMDESNNRLERYLVRPPIGSPFPLEAER